MEYLRSNWCNQAWSKWYPFRDYPSFLAAVPAAYGLYRVKPVSISALAYIGRTNNLRRRIKELVHNALMDEMPFNDPHTASPSLWAWHDAEGFEYEVSVALIDDGRPLDEAIKCYMLWKYRLERGESTMCNHGRFHPNYSRSSNRKQGIRGGKLPLGQINTASGPSYPPLPLCSQWPFSNWMGLSWSGFCPLRSDYNKKIPSTPGVYKIASPDLKVLYYVGQSRNLKSRLSTHSRESLDGIGASFSYCFFDSEIQQHKLHEIKNDLIGGYYEQAKGIPVFQFNARG